jgi:hypothetical protein
MVKPLSPALRHQQRVLAQRATGQVEAGQPTTGSQYELQLYKLAEDKRRLKAIKSIQNKIALKTQLLPDYAPWIDGVLASGKGAQDDVITTLLVWHIDIGEYERALLIARYALQYKMTLPDHYNRDIPTLLMDEFAGAYLKGQLAKDAPLGMRILEAVHQLTQDCDVPDQARAKLLKALGYAQYTVACGQDDQLELTEQTLALAHTAHQNLTHALSLFDGVGVKKDLEKLERRLKKFTIPTSN